MLSAAAPAANSLLTRYPKPGHFASAVEDDDEDRGTIARFKSKRFVGTDRVPLDIASQATLIS